METNSLASLALILNLEARIHTLCLLRVSHVSAGPIARAFMRFFDGDPAIRPYGARGACFESWEPSFGFVVCA
jgi:hypothetical protein